jgi:hypothetical protein
VNVRPRSGLWLLCAAAGTVAIATGALAYFTATGSGTASAAVSQLSSPAITAATPAAGGTVALTWKAVTAPGAGTVKYYLTRNGGQPAGTCPVVSSPQAVTSCTDSGLSPGTYEYVVTAVWSSWDVSSAVATAKVTVGPAAQFSLSGSASTMTAGGSINLTITAQDAAGSTVTTFTGSHSLVFSGASASPGGNQPTVANSSGTAVAFGSTTALTFTNGVATVASSKNGVLKLYAVGEAAVTAGEGSLTDPTPLAITVSPAAASKYSLAATTTTPTAGATDALTITALDTYGNTATAYTGAKSLTFSGAEASPSGAAPTVASSAGTATPFGSTTALNFTNGVAGVSAGANGAMVLYKSGAASIKATEGSITTPTALAVTVAAATAASLTMTAATTTPVAAVADNLTITAKDAYANTATAYTGAKSLTFSGAEASPSGAAPTVASSAGTATPFGSATALNFTNGVAGVASGKNGVLKLNKAGAAGVSATDGTLTTAPLAFTVSVGTAKRVAFSGLVASAGAIGSPCFFTCAVTTLGNSGTVKSNLMITDEVGNTVSNVGSGKSVTVTATGTAGSSIVGSPVALPETGPAVSATQFTYTAPAAGAYSNTITAASTGYTSATATAGK